MDGYIAMSDVARYQTKAAYAAAVLRDAVEQGKYTAGDRLPIAQVASELGLSLTPVREALFELASEGLIDIQPHRGARVADVPLKDMDEVYMIRAVLESTAAGRAAERAQPEEITALDDMHQQLVKAVEAEDTDSLRDLNDEFHRLIFESAKSPLLHRLIRDVAAQCPADTFHVIKERSTRTVEEHSQVLSAIRAGDAELATRRMRVHLENSLDLIRAAKTGADQA